MASAPGTAVITGQKITVSAAMEDGSMRHQVWYGGREQVTAIRELLGKPATDITVSAVAIGKARKAGIPAQAAIREPEDGRG